MANFLNYMMPEDLQMYCSYYGITRTYDDDSNITLQLESGGVLRRESDPRTDFPIEYANKEGKRVLKFKPAEEASKLLKV